MKNLLLLLTFSSFMGVAQFSVQRPLDHVSTGSRTCFADMDGDGTNDFVYYNNTGIYWRDNFESEATFHQIHNLYTIDFEIEGSDIGGIDVADIDGDGDPDVAAAIVGTGISKIVWFENLGEGNFSEYQLIFTNLTSFSIYFEDIDVDGSPDLVAHIAFGDLGSNVDLIFENLGDGTFNDPVIFHDATGISQYNAIGDLDEDGDIDLLIYYEFPFEIRWYENLGDFSFSPAIVVATDVLSCIDLVIKDINEDDKNDIVKLSEGEISWIENLGGGVFGDNHLLLSCPLPSSIAFEDIDEDSDEDLIYTWKPMGEPGFIGILEKTGPAIFDITDTIHSGTNDFNSLLLADINNDGNNDVYFRNNVTGQKVYMLNEGDLNFSEPEPLNSHSGAISQMTHGDINGDGLLDVITIGQLSGRLVWWENLGTGEFSAQKIILNNTPGLNKIVVLDLDGDLYDDLIVSNQNDLTIIQLMNLGGGIFSPPSTLSIEPVWTKELIAEDMDLDGDIDLVQTCFLPAPSGLNYFENVDGVLSPAIGIPVTEYLIEDIELADMDGDEDPDIVVQETFDGWSHFLYIENLGDGFATEIDLGVSGSRDFELGDINDDGLVDIVSAFTNWDMEMVVWLENLGGDVFAEYESLGFGYLIPIKIELVDFDLDGHTDILLGGWSMVDIIEFPDIFRAQLAWMKNVGEGIFELPEDISKELSGLTHMTVVDIDNDGDTDIFSASNQTQEIAWHRNGFLSPQQIRGNLYFDENENGLKDMGEPGLGGIQVEADPLSDFSYTFENGNYLLNFDEAPDGLYDVFPESLDHWGITSLPTPYTFDLNDDFSGASTIDFGFYPIDEETEVIGSLINEFPRCNDTILFYLSYENIGGTIADGIIELELNEYLNYVDATVLPDSITGQNIYWSIEDLFFFDAQLIQLRVGVPSFEYMDSTLVSYLTINANDGDAGPIFIYTDSLVHSVSCAYDPNDKTVFPLGKGEFGEIPSTTPYLEYTVRFQNTGTDTAINIVIKDALDSDLNWSSLKILGNSHSMTTYIDHTGELTFTFSDIMLPDSNVNEMFSHGFVKYRIDLLPELMIGTVIENTANIYFDANPPVTTNTTINTIVEDLLAISEDHQNKTNSFQIFPNPFNENTTIYFEESFGENITVDIFDLLGNRVYRNNNVTGNSLKINACQLNNGIYFVVVTSNGTQQTARIVIQ